MSFLAAKQHKAVSAERRVGSRPSSLSYLQTTPGCSATVAMLDPTLKALVYGDESSLSSAKDSSSKNESVSSDHEPRPTRELRTCATEIKRVIAFFPYMERSPNNFALIPRKASRDHFSIIPFAPLIERTVDEERFPDSQVFTTTGFVSVVGLSNVDFCLQHKHARWRETRPGLEPYYGVIDLPYERVSVSDPKIEITQLAGSRCDGSIVAVVTESGEPDLVTLEDIRSHPDSTTGDAHQALELKIPAHCRERLMRYHSIGIDYMEITNDRLQDIGYKNLNSVIKVHIAVDSLQIEERVLKDSQRPQCHKQWHPDCGFRMKVEAKVQFMGIKVTTFTPQLKHLSPTIGRLPDGKGIEVTRRHHERGQSHQMNSRVKELDLD